ncbi:MAG: hypothetical protein ACP5HP_01600 [Thermogladius sp.]
MWFKRYFSDYLGLWLTEVGFAVGVLLTPAYIYGSQSVVSKAGELFGVKPAFTDLLVFSMVLSALLGVVAIISGDMVGTLYYEFKIAESTVLIFEATGLTHYIVVNAVVRSIVNTLLSSIYLLPVLGALKGASGLITYLVVVMILVPAGVTLGLLASIVGLSVIYFVDVRRPWSIAQLLPPVILASSGVYIPVRMIPLALRVVGYITPVPFVVEALQWITLLFNESRISQYLLFLTAIYTLYVTVSVLTINSVDRVVRK